MNHKSCLQLAWCWKYLLCLPLLGFVAILGLFALFNIDHGLQDSLYRPGHGFPFQDSATYELWLHDRIKIASNSLLWLVLIAAIWPSRHLSGAYFRAPLLLAILAMIACVSTLQSLKGVTGIYCPVQLQAYGGTVELHPKISIGHLMLINDGAGRCWPGGHATVGFAWLAMFFALLCMNKKRAAVAVLIVALAYGHFLGLTQVIRGQHFLSHQFYTMAICWLISLALFTPLHLWQNRITPTRNK